MGQGAHGMGQGGGAYKNVGLGWEGAAKISKLRAEGWGGCE